jgi:hypothetical protein
MLLSYDPEVFFSGSQPSMLRALRAVDGYLYVGSPYTKYPGGIEVAFTEICRITGWLVKNGVKAFSPIAHSHPLCQYGWLDPLDHSIWLPLDKPLMDAAVGLIVVQMSGWKESHGLTEEIEVFKSAGKPIVYLRP